jgi:Uma2 family endonuclease
LVVEVLSPRTAEIDRTYKFRKYEENGVREYWLVSPNEKWIEVYLHNGSAFQLSRIYAYEPEEDIPEEERGARVFEFKTSFLDLTVNLEDAFMYTDLH